MTLTGGSTGAGAGAGMGPGMPMDNSVYGDGRCNVYPLSTDRLECLPSPSNAQVAVAVVLGGLAVVAYTAVVAALLLIRRRARLGEKEREQECECKGVEVQVGGIVG
ncbi:hypothetical protein E3P86_03444 [Wallemia ichthyophaga]|uniref:Uncharacterized protein n=1 Tax=Wallemia ichthyophaga TaxID=245174 RepID=A0A4T0IPD2_WALIC|nr:hypothetical protein E3P86_03444 [Wallemia ichthyophaga]